MNRETIEIIKTISFNINIVVTRIDNLENEIDMKEFEFNFNIYNESQMNRGRKELNRLRHDFAVQIKVLDYLNRQLTKKLS